MKISYIELLDKQYPMCWSLAASEKISEKYGSMENMQKAIGSKDFATMSKAIDFVLGTLIDAGRIYCQMAKIECPEALPCRPADLIDLSDPTAMNAMLEAMTKGNERDVEVASKNGKTTQGK